MRTRAVRIRGTPSEALLYLPLFSRKGKWQKSVIFCILPLKAISGAQYWHQIVCVCGGGALSGKMQFWGGKKSKNVPKMADLGHFFFWLGASGGRASHGGGKCPMPPLMPLLLVPPGASGKERYTTLQFTFSN